MNKLFTNRLLYALCAMLLLGGFVTARAAVISHNISSGPLTIAGTSTDSYVITGSTNSNSNYILVQKGYQGTITLNGVTIEHTNVSAVRLKGEYNRNNLDPVTKVKVILQGDNKVSLSSTGGYEAAFAVEQGAMVSFSAIDPADNASGKLTAISKTQGAAIGADYNTRGSSTTVDQTALGNEGTATAYNSNNSVKSATAVTAGGNIVISSGTFDCDTRGGHGAGIGGGFRNYYNGIIVLYGGVINCQGGTHAAGIGTGCPNGLGNDGTHTLGSTIVAFPPTHITATTQQSGLKGLAGATNTTYIGDPESPLITVYTEDYEKNATIYADLTETTSITSIFGALGIDYDLSTVRFGVTGATDGTYKTNATLVQPVTFFTDASSSQTATLGRPYKPRTVTVSAATAVVLPLLNVGMSFVVTPATPMTPGYNAAQASASAYMLKVTFTDSKPMTAVVYELQSGAASDFTGMNFFDANGTTPIAAPTTLSSGKVFYIQVPVKTGKAIGIYQDVLRFRGTWDGANTGYIRQVVTQRIVKDDTETNTNIKVTANPVTFTTTNPNTGVTLNLNINHSGLPVPYDPSDVTAKYLITTEKNYDAAVAANPVSTWSNLSVPTIEGETFATTAGFNGKPQGTYYIHWYVTSGTVYAHSKTVVGPPPATYGGFGPYIIDTTAPTVTLAVDGSTTTKTLASILGVPVTLTFNEAVKVAELTVADFEVTAGKATVSGVAVVSGSGDKSFTATLTPSGSLYNGETFTLRLKAGAVTDVAGNSSAVSNTVTLSYTNTAKPAVAFNTAPAYSSLRPSFTAAVTPGDYEFNNNTDLYQTAGGAAIAGGSNLASLFTVTPEGGSALTSGYTATYSKSGSGASAKGVITFSFSVDLTNSKNYTVAAAAGKFFNLLQNSNESASATFLIAKPDFGGGTAGISILPTLLSDEGGTAALTIKGYGLKLNADANLLSLRVKCPAIGFDSGLITSGFVIEGGMDKVTIPNVAIPANTGSTTQTHTFELFMTFDGPESSTGETCQLQVEPAMSYIVSVVNTTTSTGDLTFGYSVADAQASNRRQNITVTNNGATTLNGLTVTFAGPDGTHFASTTPSPATGLAPGSTATFYVYLAQGKNAGTYAGGPSGSETKVTVTATSGVTPLNGSAVLVQQRVNPAPSVFGTEATVTGNPAPSLSVMTQNSIILTVGGLTPGDILNDWKYAVVTTNARPVDTDLAWTPVTGGTPAATHTFADGTLDSYYIFYGVNTQNYTGIEGQVEDSGVKVYNVDLVPPAVVSITPERNTTNASPITANVVFSEPVGDMDASRFVATNATVGNLTPVGTPVNGRYAEYRITVTPVAGLVEDNVIVISVQASAGRDEAGNYSLASTSSVSGVVIFNDVNPLVTLTTPDMTVNANFTVTAVFTKPISGFEISDIVVSNGSVQPGSLNPAGGNGTTFTFVINTAASSSGNINVTVPENAVTDNASNGNIDSELDVDFRSPLDRIAGVLTYTGPAYENGPFTVNVHFERNVTGLLAADFNYTASDFSAPELSGAGKNYVLTFTPLVNKDNTTAISLKASISAVDEYGNSLNGSNTVNVSYDTRKPVVTHIFTDPAITEIHFDPFTIKVILDEEVNSFDPGKLILNGLTLIEVLSGPDVVSGTTEYSLSVKVAQNTPSGSTVTLALAEGAVKDKAGNPNGAGNGSITPFPGVLFIDNIPPDIINMSIPPASAPPSGDIAFTFDEPLDVTTPGTIWLEDVGTIPTGKIDWLDQSTVNFDHGRLAEGMTYVVRVSGYLDLAGNVMAPRVFSFTVGEPAYPVIQRPVIIQLGSGLRIAPPISNEPFYVSSRNDFSFTVWPTQGGNLDSLVVETGIPLRDLEGILKAENPDGSITVTLVRVNESMMTVAVYLKGVTAAETVGAADVWASGRQVYVRTDRAATLSIYTLDGGLYRQLTVGAGVTVESLPPGYYTIVLDGKTYKAVIQ